MVVMTTSKATGTEVLTDYERWKLPRVDGPMVSSTAKELESIQEQAYNEGFALGQKEGFEQKKQETGKKCSIITFYY